ncbi:MAG TPA: pectate lyase [Pirellulales bacterium]
MTAPAQPVVPGPKFSPALRSRSVPARRLGSSLALLGCCALGACWTIGSVWASPREHLKKPANWFATAEAKQVAANVLSYQSALGGWPKNEDTTARPYQGDRQKLKPTYDNGATTDELRFLAKMENATHDGAYRTAFERGLDYVLDGQYSHGGWPQFHPPGNGYHRRITFNDNAMVRLMEFVREVATSADYEFVDEARRRAAGAAFNRGVACILKCQIPVDGRLTGWCAQHDELDFRPQPARTFEPASLSGAESVGVVRLLMSLDDPSPEVVNAVEGAVAWLERAKLSGVRVVEVKDPQAPQGVNKVVESDPRAAPLWARFYEIGANRPLFVDRDGVPKATLAEIGYERRNGYAWYGTWPQRLLEVEHPKWKERIAKRAKGRENQ